MSESFGLWVVETSNDMLGRLPKIPLGRSSLDSTISAHLEPKDLVIDRTQAWKGKWTYQSQGVYPMARSCVFRFCRERAHPMRSCIDTIRCELGTSWRNLWICGFSDLVVRYICAYVVPRTCTIVTWKSAVTSEFLSAAMNASWCLPPATTFHVYRLTIHDAVGVEWDDLNRAMRSVLVGWFSCVLLR